MRAMLVIRELEKQVFRTSKLLRPVCITCKRNEYCHLYSVTILFSLAMRDNVNSYITKRQRMGGCLQRNSKQSWQSTTKKRLGK
jgi:hypothetical protein